MIEIDVEKRVGNFTLEAQFETPSSGVTALFGRSGSGKTTLVDMIAGLISPTRGRIVVDQQVMFDSEQNVNLPPEKRQLGYVFQEDRLFPHMSVASNLRYGRLHSSNGPDFNRIAELLGIGSLLDRRPGSLSGGEKQRVSIGRALLANPRLLLMDEPLASLDSARKNEILPFIEEFSSELKIPIIYVSHAMEEIIRLADTIILISDGRIATVGSMEDVTSRLDLRPLTGRYEAGSVIRAVVTGHEQENDLTQLDFAGGSLRIPRIPSAPGHQLRIRIRARDVSLAIDKPQNISVMNIFPGVISEISEQDDAAVDILVDTGVPIWARISKASVKSLDLVPGKRVHAMVKAVAIDRYSLGGIRQHGDR